jgi:hypothetical protein
MRAVIMQPLNDVELGIKADAVGQIVRKYINNAGIDKSILPKQSAKSALRTKSALKITPITCWIEQKDGSLIDEDDYELIKQYVELISTLLQLYRLQNP